MNPGDEVRIAMTHCDIAVAGLRGTVVAPPTLDGMVLVRVTRQVRVPFEDLRHETKG